MSIEKMKAELAQVSEKIVALDVLLTAAWNEMVAAKADRYFTHPLYRKWKTLDERDTKLRHREADLREEIEWAEDEE